MNSWRAALIVLAAAGSLAAAPRSGSFMITANTQPFIARPAHVDVTAAAPGFTPAPTPNRDTVGPQAPRQSMKPTLMPDLFTRKEQYRGDGFAPNSTAQTAEEKRFQPAAGLNLTMPIQ